MCGIAGYIGTHPLPNDRLDRVCRELRRRGPDWQSFQTFTFPHGVVHFAHSRLSIIDLDPRSHQPFSDDRYTIIFNGEIYNYRELRSDLEQRGETFITESDTEVFLKAYRAHGVECFDLFEGMWATAILDKHSGTVCLSRDRFGEKPLMYLVTPKGIFFSSEVKALATLIPSQLDINYAQVCRNLACGFRSLYKNTETFFKGVRQFPAGHYALLTMPIKPTCEPKPYWQPRFETNDTMSISDAVSGIQSHLERSLRLRMRSDVPIAFCLSGGIDSAGLVSLAKKRLGCNVSSFSIIDSDPRFNERSLIEAVIEDCNIEGTLVELSTDNFIPRMEKLIQHRAAPIATISYYVHSLLMEAVARSGRKVVVSGTGADEMFSGYYDHFLLHAASTFTDPDFAKHESAWTEFIRPLVRNPGLLDFRKYIHSPSSREHLYSSQADGTSFLKTDFRFEFSEVAYTSDLFRNRMANELFHEIVPVILFEDDANSMYESLENRSPFLDRELYEFACSIPSRYLIQNGYGKFLLREALSNILVDSVRLNREKKGFNAAILSVFDRNDPLLVEWLLTSGPLLEIVKREKIEQLLNLSYFPDSMSKVLFNIISTKVFLDYWARVPSVGQ